MSRDNPKTNPVRKWHVAHGQNRPRVMVTYGGTDAETEQSLKDEWPQARIKRLPDNYTSPPRRSLKLKS